MQIRSSSRSQRSTLGASFTVPRLHFRMLARIAQPDLLFPSPLRTPHHHQIPHPPQMIRSP